LTGPGPFSIVPPWPKRRKGGIGGMDMRASRGGAARGVAVAAALAACLAFVSGCTALRDAGKGVARGVSDAGRSVGEVFSGGRPGGLQLAVAVFGLEEPASAGAAEFAALLRRQLAEQLGARCGGLLVDRDFAQLLGTPPRLASGAVDGHALALLARRRGVNNVVVGSPLEPRITEEKTGFWFWKGSRVRVSLGLRLEVFDAETGGKSLDERFWEEAVLELETEYPGAEIPLETIPAAVTATLRERLLAQAGRDACRHLAETPWRGFVVAVQGRELTVSAGRGVGLREGMRLEVFAPGRPLANRDGQRFLLPGVRLGEARLREVGEARSVAVLDEAAAVEAGATVRLKP